MEGEFLLPEQGISYPSCVLFFPTGKNIVAPDMGGQWTDLPSYGTPNATSRAYVSWRSQVHKSYHDRVSALLSEPYPSSITIWMVLRYQHAETSFNSDGWI